jgi:hypothetical protein
MKLKKGDYVLATKYTDGDPREHWCVGFFDSKMDYKVRPRYNVVDDNGNPFRYNGFRRCIRISAEVGNKLLENGKYIEMGDKSVWWWKLKFQRELKNEKPLD